MNAGGIQHQSFQDRLKRVKAGGANTSGQVYAGVVEPRQKRKRYETRITQDMVAQPRPSPLKYPMHLIFGLLIGAAAVVLARYLRFQVDGGAITGVNADLIMGVDIIVAISIAIVMRVVFRFYSKLHGLAKLIGVMATVVLMQNGVHMYPGLFEKAFSVRWVDTVLRTTQANSILIAGTSYDFAMQELVVATNTNRRR